MHAGYFDQINSSQQGQFCSTGDTWQYLEIFFLIGTMRLGGGGNRATGN